MTALRPPGTPLALLLRPSYAPVDRGPADRPAPGEDEPSWGPSRGDAHGVRARLWAAARLAFLAVSVGAGVATTLVVTAAGLWWWLGQLASASPRH